MARLTLVYDQDSREMVSKEELQKRRAAVRKATTSTIYEERPVERGTWRWDANAQEVISTEEWYRRRGHDSRIGLQIVKDIDPYIHAITGKPIMSRKQHQDTNRAYGVTEVGNETKHMKAKPYQEAPGLREAIKESYEQLRAGHEVARPRFHNRGEWNKGLG